MNQGHEKRSPVDTGELPKKKTINLKMKNPAPCGYSAPLL